MGSVRVLAIALLLGLAYPGLPALAAALDAEEVFQRYSDLVVQIRVVETASGAKASLGSGFVSTEDGHVVTNFHVISEPVHHPERYRVELIDAAGDVHPVKILAFDIVNDLAVVLGDYDFQGHFEITTAPLTKGVRLYSLGNPYDLGLSIIEGTYNGLHEYSLYEKIHFTGSLNPGMSGGPALTTDAEVVGVNVSSGGDQVSFLVPAEHVETLLARVRVPDFSGEADVSDLREQLLEYQNEYMRAMLEGPIETVRLGRYELPSKLAPFFNCWGDSTHDEEDLYESVVHSCSTYDNVYISRGQSASIVQVRHLEVHSDELNTARFYQLYTGFFERNNSFKWGSEEVFTPFRCETGFVENSDVSFKTTFCVRRYKKLEGLYDAVFKAAILGEKSVGVNTALVLSAVSFENAALLARRYLEAIQWAE